jgi:NTE family protein
MRRYTAPVYGLINPAVYDDGLRRASEGRDVEDLPVPYFTTAINLTRNRYEIIDRGPVWEAMRATSSIPGLLPPFARGGELLADGAGYDSLPIFAMRERLSGPIVGVNFAEVDEPAHSHDYERRPHWLKRLLGAGPPGAPPFPLLKDSLVQAFRFSGNSRLPESMQACDLLLSPRPPPGAGFLNWGMHRQLLETGYAHAMERVAELEKAGDEGLRKIREALV